MRNSLCMKGITLGMIVLFVGTSIIPLVSTRANHNQISQSVQLIIIDDGWGDPNDKKMDIPAYHPGLSTPTLSIDFTILGVNNSESTVFYGDDWWEDYKNITISGDILYPVNSTTLFHTGTRGNWTYRVTPTKPSGVISLWIDWPGNGSANDSIQIVNGTSITPFINTFLWGKDINITISLRNMDGEQVKFGEVYLYWGENDAQLNHTIGDNSGGNGANGEYTFWITKEEQGNCATKNIIIAAKESLEFEDWGYTKVKMRQSNLPPPPTIIEGPNQGWSDINYSFWVSLWDLDDDKVYYMMDWGDGNVSTWIGPYTSGLIIRTDHLWTQAGSYEIRGKLKDEYGLESNWSDPHIFNITELKSAFIFGKITHYSEQENYTTFEAEKTRVLIFSPFSFNTYVSGEQFTISTNYKGCMLITARHLYIIALCKLLL